MESPEKQLFLLKLGTQRSALIMKAIFLFTHTQTNHHFGMRTSVKIMSLVPKSLPELISET
jgi:hypothetical protein